MISFSFLSFFQPKFTAFKFDQENEWGLKSNKVYSMTTDSYDMIWAATAYGLEYLSSDGIRDYDYDKSNLGFDVILDVEIFDNDENLMIATNKGIKVINTNSDSMREVSSEFTYDLEITKAGEQKKLNLKLQYFAIVKKHYKIQFRFSTKVSLL